MLFRRETLEGLSAGRISLAFRRWERARVRRGSRLRTAVGVLAVEAVDVVAIADITEEEAGRAGYASPAELRAELDARGVSPVHRIELRFAGPDPRVMLRTRDDLSADDVAELTRRLARLDAASRRGPWTTDYLRMIRDRPETRAPDLAASVGRETARFKASVRRLKELGLTESLAVGYRLSPRGRAFLARLEGEAGGG